MSKKWIAFSVLMLVGCSHSQRAVPPVAKVDNETIIARGLAGEDVARGFTEDRVQFDGSFKGLVKEFKLMRGNFERGKILALSPQRQELLTKNLHDTGVDPAQNAECESKMARNRTDFALFHRTPDGTCYMYRQGQFLTGATETDLSHLLRMGAKNQRFGRNTSPIAASRVSQLEDAVLTPDPLKISQTFFSRTNETGGFKPVPWVNLLAAPFLQAMNHDWFSHGKNVTEQNMYDVPGGPEHARMFEPYRVGRDQNYVIPRTMPDISALNGQNPGIDFATGQPLENPQLKYGRKYRNAVTHWWDSSFIYGSDEETIKRVRTVPDSVSYRDPKTDKVYEAKTTYPDGRVAVDEQNRKLYYRPDPKADGELLPITGFHDNWWIGLEMIHTVFALEHNQTVTKLKDHFEAEVAKRNNKPLYSYYASLDFHGREFT